MYVMYLKCFTVSECSTNIKSFIFVLDLPFLLFHFMKS